MIARLPMGKPVEVVCSSSKYQGVLQSMSETDIFLMTATNRVALPLELIKDIRVLEPRESDRLLKLMGRKR